MMAIEMRKYLTACLMIGTVSREAHDYRNAFVPIREEREMTRPCGVKKLADPKARQLTSPINFQVAIAIDESLPSFGSGSYGCC